jgi:hypothetical protein
VNAGTSAQRAIVGDSMIALAAASNRSPSRASGRFSSRARPSCRIFAFAATTSRYAMASSSSRAVARSQSSPAARNASATSS